MISLEGLFAGILIAGMISTVPSIALLVIILKSVKRSERSSYPKYELEIVEKDVEKSEDSSLGVTISGVPKYKARYFNNRECLVTFESTRDYEVGDCFWGYVSSDGKEVTDVNHMNESRVGKTAYILIFGLYALCICIVIGFAFPDIGQYFSAGLVGFLVFLIVALITILVGVKLLIESRRFEKRKQNNCYCEIPATVESFRKVTYYEPTRNGKRRKMTDYCPVFTYDLNGQKRTFSSAYGKSSPEYKVGQQVVLYWDSTTQELSQELSSGKGGAKIIIGIGVFIFFMAWMILIATSIL